MAKSADSSSRRFFDGVPGPTPWYSRPGAPAPDGFRWEQTNERWPKHGKTLLVGPEGAVAVLGFYNYVTRLDSSTLLIWNQKKGTPYEGSPPVHLAVIRPKALSSFGANLENEILRMETRGALLALPDKPSAAIDLNTGVVGEDIIAVFPTELQAIEELLILCDSSGVNRPEAMNVGLALLVARPKQGIFRIYPQDWFNFADLDFGYQWVTRIARDPHTGRVFGEGFRIDPFELDDTLCNLVKSKS